MIRALGEQSRRAVRWTWLVVLSVLVSAAYLGSRASLRWLGLITAVVGAIAILQQPMLGLASLIVVAQVIPISFSTGTAVTLNLAVFVIPLLMVMWLLRLWRLRSLQMQRSRTMTPLVLFLVGGLFSLLIGNVTWEPLVSRSQGFLLVQLAQWAIFAFSVMAFWLMGSLITNLEWLKRLTWLYLTIAGGIALFAVVPPAAPLLRLSTGVASNAAFWTLLVGVSGGQLAFNRKLSTYQKLLLVVILLAAMRITFFDQRQATSLWIGVAVGIGMLFWFRFPRWRPVIGISLLVLALLGLLVPTVYNFAGGDVEWQRSGGSRLVLIKRVVDVTMRNPITGLGPAAYRRYAAMEPLAYGRAFWLVPTVNSHNNYVDLFAQVGILGLAFFCWFAWELARLGIRLRQRFPQGFSAGYVNGMLATGMASLVVMVFADWILPFVYNIGFPGFQASVLIWLFLGGLVALDNMPQAVPVISDR